MINVNPYDRDDTVIDNDAIKRLCRDNNYVVTNRLEFVSAFLLTYIC